MLDIRETTLLITSCIMPSNNIYKIALSSVESRFEQYIESIKWAITETKFSNIVFCDNSGYDISNIREIGYSMIRGSEKHFECLSFRGSQDVIEKQGKGYGEGEIIDYALNESKLLCDSTFICKLTGRLKVDNIQKFIRGAHNNKIYLWTSGLNINGNNSVKGIETRFYGLPIEIYKATFRYSYLQVDDKANHFLENCFYDDFTSSSISAQPIYFYPDFSGQSGSMGTDYKISKSKVLGKTIASGLGFYCPKR